MSNLPIKVHSQQTFTFSSYKNRHYHGVSSPVERPGDFESTAILTRRGGMIAEYRGVLDLLTLMQQLGAAAPTSF